MMNDPDVELALVQGYELILHVTCVENKLKDYGHVCWMSEVFRNRCPGWSEEFLFSAQLDDICTKWVHPDDRTRFYALTRREAMFGALRGKSRYIVDFRMVWGDHKVVYLSLVINKVEKEGEIVGFVVFLKSNADRAREHGAILALVDDMRSRYEMLHGLVEAGSWMITCGSYGELNGVCWSDTLRRLLGYSTREDFPDRYDAFLNCFAPEDRAEHMRNLGRILSRADKSPLHIAEFRLQTRDRGFRWYRSNGEVDLRPDGTVERFRGILVDITAEKLEEMVRGQQRALDEQQAILREALVRAETASRAKSHFLFNLSHDIRTPMNAIMGFTELARRHVEDTEKTQDYLAKAEIAGRHLLSLINDVLDVSRIESNKLNLDVSPCAIGTLMGELETIAQGVSQPHRLTVSFDLGGTGDDLVLCDRLRIHQILLNLLSNAIKFTPEGGKIAVSVRRVATEVAAANYLFTVRDTGVGVSAEFQERMFEPFERAKNATQSGVPGTGLGLSIVHGLVNRMGGTIRVESEMGHGTTFTVSLRLGLAAPESVRKDAPSSEESVREDRSAIRLLVVDDNELNREIALELLRDAGYTCEAVDGGAEAVERVSSEPAGTFAAVLMDIQMPDMDGFEATRAIRALSDAAKASVPIVAMTANAFAEDRAAALAAGMNEHLAKPIDMKRLSAVLSALVG